MSTLHTVNKSPFGSEALLSCLEHCLEGDAVLMIEDGVYGALAGSRVSDVVQAKTGTVSLYLLTPDADARGLGNEKRLGEVEAIGYDGFVDLVAEHDRTQAWL